MAALSMLCAVCMQDWVPSTDDEGAEMDAQLLFLHHYPSVVTPEMFLNPETI